MRYIFSLIILFIVFSETSKATNVVCKNADYAGKKLEFFQFTNPVTLESELLFTLKFDANGKCNEQINVNSTTFTFCDFGVYRGMLFIEPNQTISIKLPPLREKSFADQKNPYFKPIAFWFATDNKNQINNQVLDFTKSFNQLTDKFFHQLYFRQSKETLDSVEYLLDKEFSHIQSDIFANHKNLTLKLVEVDAQRKKPAEYSDFFSTISKEYWLHPAFIELYGKTFGKQLSFEAKAISGKDLETAVNKGDVNFLLKFTKSKYKIEGKIAELALLKMLHDAFYSEDFAKNSIKNMVQSPLFKNNSNEIIKETSKSISQKFTFLQKGSAAPVICLPNLEGNKVCTNKTHDKFKYIVFADTEMIVCREHLKYLVNIQQRFQKHLEIIIVLRKSNVAEMKKFLKEAEVPGIKLIDETNKYIADYKIRSFPQCFLLDEKHNVKFISAKAPLDGFEQQFGKFLQQELFTRQRNQSR